MSQLARQSKGLDPRATTRDESHLTASVVVCTRNRPGSLRNCLQGIAGLEHPPDEVIVVDNTSGDHETEACAKDFGAIYMVEPNQGLSRARNRGLAESHFEIVAYLDDDATPDVHWLGTIIQPFKDPQVTTVTGRIITPESKVRANALQEPRSLSNKDPEWFGIATFGGLGLGSNMAFRREACIGKKLFDERLGRGAPFEIAGGKLRLRIPPVAGLHCRLPSRRDRFSSSRKGPRHQAGGSQFNCVLHVVVCGVSNTAFRSLAISISAAKEKTTHLA